MKIYDGIPEKKDADYLISYINNIIIPASHDFFILLEDNELKLHNVFSFNAILAHAIDYIWFIVGEKNIERWKLVNDFDSRYAIEGCVHLKNKFSLLNALNNSFKHVELKKKPYAPLINQYGDITHLCLKESNGKIFFQTPSHKFDYSRVVLRPIAKIFNCNLSTSSDIAKFINGTESSNFSHKPSVYSSEPDEAIDNLIHHYSSAICLDCEEDEDQCDCSNFVYGNKPGKFEPVYENYIDIDEHLANISGTREFRK
jgi:hypothetical protein